MIRLAKLQGTVSLGLLSWLIGLMVNSLNQQVFCQTTVLISASLEKAIYLHRLQGRGAGGEGRQWGCLSFSGGGWAHVRLHLEEVNKREKPARTGYPVPHVKASQAACEVTLSSSIQTTSGAKALSRLFSAVSHPLSTWCQFWKPISFSIFFPRRSWMWFLFSVLLCQEQLGKK